MASCAQLYNGSCKAIYSETVRLQEDDMTYYGGKELAAAFRTVRNNTIQIAEEIPEDKYAFKPAPDCRSVGQTLVHIAASQGLQFHIQSNKIADLTTFN